MTVSITAKSRTISNGDPGDAAPVEQNFVELYNNDDALATKVDNLLGGAIEDATTLTINSNYTGSSPGNMAYMAERGTLPNTGFRWNETKAYWEVTNDGTNYHPVVPVLASDPGSPVEGDIWYNSTTHLLKYQDNSATQTVSATIALTPVSRSSNTILGTSDRGKLFVFTSTFTQTLTAAATLTSGWYCYVRNDGTGVITIDPNASETIDNLTTIKMYPGEVFTIVCDGSNFKVIGRKHGEVLIKSQAASGSASIDFTTGLADTEFTEFVFKIFHVVPATDSTALWARFSTDSGSSYAAAGTDYVYSGDYEDSAGGSPNVVSSAGTAAQIVISPGSLMGNSTGEAYSVNLRLPNPSNSAIYKQITGNGGGYSATPRNVVTRISGAYVGATSAINGVRFLESSGNITSGTFELWGVRP